MKQLEYLLQGTSAQKLCGKRIILLFNLIMFRCNSVSIDACPECENEGKGETQPIVGRKHSPM